MDWPVVLKNRAPGLVLGFGLVLAAPPTWPQAAKDKAIESPPLWDAAPTPATARTPRPDSYIVQGVDSSDTLNIRARADSRSALVGKIPPDARGVHPTGRRKQSGQSTWWEVSYGSYKSWVNARFLAPDAGPAAAAGGSAPGDPMPPPL